MRSGIAMGRRAKIAATIGPATDSYEHLLELAEAGMDIARLNFSHGSHEEHAKAIEGLRKASQAIGKPIGILQDLQGPKIRTGGLAHGGAVSLEPGMTFVLTTRPAAGDAERVHVEYAELPRDVRPGKTILIDDGRLELKVTEVGEHEVTTEVVVGGLLEEFKGLNLPGVKISAPSLTPKDLVDLRFGLHHKVDFIALSFVRRAEDVLQLRQVIQRDAPEQTRLPIIAKLERPEAVEHLEAIIEAADGVMVARGDLGVELPSEKVPSIQKRIIRQANDQLKTVITATQMLESMITNPKPTRAEASDVANAVFDGSDALMLSGETAVGEYPIEAVETMARIILDAEDHAAEWGMHGGSDGTSIEDDAVSTTLAARRLAQDRNVDAIAVFTRSGRTASLMSKARPNAPILAFTPEQETYFRMALLWGVEANLVPMAHSVEEMVARVEDALLTGGRIRGGGQVVLVASLPIGAMGPANFTYLHSVGHRRRTSKT